MAGIPDDAKNIGSKDNASVNKLLAKTSSTIQKQVEAELKKRKGEKKK